MKQMIRKKCEEDEMLLYSPNSELSLKAWPRGEIDKK